MKKIVPFAFLILGLYSFAFAQMDLAWQKNLGPSLINLPLYRDFKVDNDGSVYVLYSRDSVSKLNLVKYNNYGMIEWEINYIAQNNIYQNKYNSILISDSVIYVISSRIYAVSRQGGVFWEKSESDFNISLNKEGDNIIDESGNLVIARIGSTYGIAVRKINTFGGLMWAYNDGPGLQPTDCYLQSDSIDNTYILCRTTNSIDSNRLYKVSELGTLQWIRGQAPPLSSLFTPLMKGNDEVFYYSVPVSHRTIGYDMQGNIVHYALHTNNLTMKKMVPFDKELLITWTNNTTQTDILQKHIDNAPTPYFYYNGNIINIITRGNNVYLVGIPNYLASPSVHGFEIVTLTNQLIPQDTFSYNGYPYLFSKFDHSEVDEEGTVYTMGVYTLNDLTNDSLFLLKVCGACRNNIAGKVFLDYNQNCQPDTLEPGLANISLLNDQGLIYTQTKAGGTYSLRIDSGLHTIKISLPDYSQSCIDSINILADVSTSISNLDFPIKYTPGIYDKVIELETSLLRRNRAATGIVSIVNNGAIADSSWVYIIPDSNLTVNSTIPPFDSVAGNTYFWKYHLGINEQKIIILNLRVSVNVNLGDTLTMQGYIERVVVDTTPQNNMALCKRTVTGGMDPNDKTAYVTNLSATGDVTDSSEFSYVIRFQNTGNDTAFDIYILDTIDTDFDLSSIKMIIASHNYTWNFVEPGVIKWTFTNILLPDSNTNEPLSHGLIKYSIRPKSNTANYTVFINSASIYFDYNLPVKTNTTVNFFEAPFNSISYIAGNSSKLLLVPNPASGYVKLITDGMQGELKIEIYDVLGNRVQQNNIADDNVILDIHNLPKGILLIKVTDCKNNIATAKLINF